MNDIVYLVLPNFFSFWGKSMTVNIVNSTVSARQLKDLFIQIANGSLRSEHMQAFLDRRDPFTKRHITVSPKLTLAERVMAGKYDWRNNDIDESCFLHDSTVVGEWECDLYGHHAEHTVSSEDVKSFAEVDGWEIAKAEHLLAFGSTYPDEQRKFFVIALGSVGVMRSGHRCVVVLHQEVGQRIVTYCPYNSNWGSRQRFLRVRRVLQLVA